MTQARGEDYAARSVPTFLLGVASLASFGLVIEGDGVNTAEPAFEELLHLRTGGNEVLEELDAVVAYLTKEGKGTHGVDGGQGDGTYYAIGLDSQDALHVLDGGGCAAMDCPIDHHDGYSLGLDVVCTTYVPIEGADDVLPLGLGETAKVVNGGLGTALELTIVGEGAKGDTHVGGSAGIVGVVDKATFLFVKERDEGIEVGHTIRFMIYEL